MGSFGAAPQRQVSEPVSENVSQLHPPSQKPDERYALVPYQDLAELFRPPRRGIWFWVGVIAPWVIGVFSWLFVWKSVSERRAVQFENTSQLQSLAVLAKSVGDQNAQVGSVAASVKNLTGAVVFSSARTDEIEAGLQRTRRELKRLETRLQAQEELGSFSSDGSDSGTSAPQRVHRHKIAQDLKLGVPGGQVLQDSNGHVLYWLVPRIVSDHVHMIKVLPITANQRGILVHSVAANEDYIITQSGDWTRADDPGLFNP